MQKKLYTYMNQTDPRKGKKEGALIVPVIQ